MKKIYSAVIIGIILTHPVSVLAETDQTSGSSQIENYQNGLKAAAEAKNNQALWEQGKGDPRMAKGYQDGLDMAAEGKRNEALWRQGKE